MILDSLQPLNDLIVIRRIVEEAPRSAAGILLPPTEESANTPYRGVVVAAGPGKPTKLSGAGTEVVDALAGLLKQYHLMPNQYSEDPRGFSLAHWQRAADALKNHVPFPRRMLMSVKGGDTVIFSKNLFQEFKLDGEVFVVMGEASIMGIL